MTACREGSLAEGEQLLGSAPAARTWLALEQPGPWGAKAFTQSHLDPALGARIEELAARHRTRPVLVRRPGRHADPPGPSGPRRLLLAHTHPARTWLLEGTITAPDEVLALDWGALHDGDRDAVRRSLPALAPSDRAHLLVCTNGRRDVCCALTGRPLALALGVDRPEQVWEVTHTSGHRFAPTAVLLPHGTLHGRLDETRALALLTAAGQGRTVLPGSRGRSTWSAPGQVAELAVRTATAETGLDRLPEVEVLEEGEHRWQVTVRHADGRAWNVRVTSEATGTSRAESCGKELAVLRRWLWTVEASAASIG